MSMTSNIETYKTEFKRLEEQAADMLLDLSLRVPGAKSSLKKHDKEIAEKVKDKFEREYQRWYTEASAVVRQLLPERLDEFVGLYQADNRRKHLNNITYSIQDWLNGIRAGENHYHSKAFDDLGAVIMRFQTQRGIFEAVNTRFESSLHDIKRIVQADLFDSELETGKELVKHGFGRGGGAVAGVVLEKHLADVAANHNLKFRKKKSGGKRLY